MALSHYLWSRTAASNASSDPSVNWAEGQAPSSVNDSARAMMASAAGYRDDIAGAIVTGGTSTAYTVTSYQVFNSLINMSGKVIAFTPHVTSGATVTLNVDGLGAKPLRTSTGVELTTGTLILGTPYTATYNNVDAVWYLHGFYGNPYNIPVGGIMDYIGSTSPNSAFVTPIGQFISRATYATLFSLIGTTFGPGDGSTTFTLPDLQGRVTALREDTVTRLTASYFGGASTAIGATGGLESTTLTLSQIPAGISTVNNSSIALSVTTTQKVLNGPNAGSAVGGGTQLTASDAGSGGALSLLGSTGSIAIGGIIGTSNNTGGTAHRTVQPTMIVNKLLRII